MLFFIPLYLICSGMPPMPMQGRGMMPHQPPLPGGPPGAPPGVRPPGGPPGMRSMRPMGAGPSGQYDNKPGLFNIMIS